MKSLVIAALFIGESQALAQNRCANLLFDRAGSVKPVLKVKSAEGLIAYLNDLLNHRVIGDKELSRLIQGLEKGEVINPISEKEAMVNSAALMHREGLQKYIDDPNLEQKLLLEWAQKTHAERNRVQEAREEARVVTESPYLKMEFRPIPAGTFMMGEKGSQVEVQITRSFEMMSTPLTQSMWVEEMGENPSKFKNGDHSITVLINGKSIQMQPDHPVETVSWDDVQVLIQKRNERDPSYHYRLATEAEWEYAARAGSDTEYSYGNDPEELSSYAWYAQNSNGQTHAVGELLPNAFGLYDMHGNVREWVSDWYGAAPKKSSSPLVDPTGPEDGSSRVLRGGSWYYDALDLRSANRGLGAPGGRSCHVGARLVRTRR